VLTTKNTTTAYHGRVFLVAYEAYLVSELSFQTNLRLLTVDGMRLARSALIERFPWFVHVKPLKYFEEIRKDGIHPRSLDCASPQWFTDALADRLIDVRKIICLRPMGGVHETLDTTPNREETGFRMALPAEWLPEIVTLDWTFSGALELAEIIKSEGETDVRAFCDTARRRGSVVVYQALPTNVLRVQTKGNSVDQIEEWPALATADEKDLLLIPS
jgi:hypothetical protein